MATGRMIQRKISLNKAINELSSDTCRLAFTWAIAHLDYNGRIQGDPAALKSIIFPRRKDVTTQEMEGFIREWYNSGLVYWYKANDDLWIEFIKFDNNQPGLRKDRETKSYIPGKDDGELLPKNYTVYSGNLPETLRNESGNLPETLRNESGNLPETLRNESGNLPETLRNESGNLPAQINRMEYNINLPRAEGIRNEKPIEEQIPFDNTPPAAPSELKNKTKKLKHSEDEIKAHNEIKAYFDKNNHRFFDFAKESEGIYRFISYAKLVKCKTSFLDFSIKATETFLRLKDPKSQFFDPLFEKQPCLPSVITSKGLWPRVFEAMNKNKGESERKYNTVVYDKYTEKMINPERGY